MSVFSDGHRILRTASIAIEDWAHPELGKHLTVRFYDGRDIAAILVARRFQSLLSRIRESRLSPNSGHRDDVAKRLPQH